MRWTGFDPTPLRSVSQHASSMLWHSYTNTALSNNLCVVHAATTVVCECCAIVLNETFYVLLRLHDVKLTLSMILFGSSPQQCWWKILRVHAIKMRKNQIGKETQYLNYSAVKFIHCLRSSFTLDIWVMFVTWFVT